MLAAVVCLSPAFAGLSDAERNWSTARWARPVRSRRPRTRHRVTLPRRDVSFQIGGRAMHPFMGFTFEDEVSPAMSAAPDSGLEVTALQNHFIFESPRALLMHIGGGVGSAAQLAAAVRHALDAVKEVRWGESRRVLKVLRRGGIPIVTIHNHMTPEQPQYVFLHHWGKGPVAGLAKVLRTAMDATRRQENAGVVLVCEHDAAKGVLAASYFNEMEEWSGCARRGARHPSGSGVLRPRSWQAWPPRGCRGLSEGAPVALAGAERSSAELVVFLSLKASAGGYRAKELEWMDVPAVSDGYDAAAASIRKRVAALMQSFIAK